MRVLILLDALSLGGAEKQALLFADWLQNTKGDTVEIWAFMEGDFSFKIAAERYSIKTKVIGYFRGLARYLYPKQIRNYSKLFNYYKPDVLMSYTNQPNLLLGLVWKKTTAKTFIWGQQGIEAAGYPFEKKADKIALENTPYFISNSINGANFLKNELKVNEEKIQVVYNGPEILEPKFTRSEWRKKLGLNDNDFVTLMVAHIALRKDHETILRAWKVLIDDENLKIKPVLLLAGIFGEGIHNLYTLMYQLDLFPYVKFLGNIEDIVGLNLASDIHVLSSHTEGLPNSLLEAMRLKLPVVGSEIPGIEEALGEENLDCLASPKNHIELSEKIKQFINNPKKISIVGERNFNRIQKLFSLEKMCNIHYEIMLKEVNKK